jgi:hypothetical protein
MITYTKFTAFYIYFNAGIFGITAPFAFFGGLFSMYVGALALSFIAVPIAYLLHLFAQAHFRLARRAKNYIMLCKVVGINDDKEHSEEFFERFTFESKN